MRFSFFMFSVLSMLFGACSGVNKVTCETKICTQEFRTVEVQFKDQTGNPVQVNDFKAIIKRTGKSTSAENETSQPGVYIVASDADTKGLSERGDEIIVTAVHAASGKRTSASFVVAGGACACHINRLSGPAEIVF